jgi:TorA maturation chaperone TorD
MGGPSVEPVGLAEEDAYRAQFYLLLSRLLGAPVDTDALAMLRGLDGDDSELGCAISEFSVKAAATSLEDAGEEYSNLFIGITRGELLPYGSYYLTGFLNEKPLVDLRQDLEGYGIARSKEGSIPEDHIATLCEIMHAMIVGRFGEMVSLHEQNRFFRKHIDSWAAKFFEDLEKAKSASLYAPLGRIGKLFLEIEGEAFEMAA